VKQRKPEQENDIVQNKNPTIFYFKNKTRIKESYDKKTYTKLVLSKLNVIQGLTFIYTP
jgi:hypothetical protein